MTMARAHLIAFGLALLASSAGAQDDGGARSLFAQGAGSRALSLGGAFAAIADDPSAIMWNPAGLASLSRYEFQGSHSSLVGLGFSEQYATFALPSWRWGTFSVNLRHFGVDGVEGRDDRNVITDPDLSDSQTELSLGYARAVAENWSVGGSFKLRRQSLAGYADSGVGIDVGVHARPLVLLGSQHPWARAFTAGLSVRNIVEPSLKLDRIHSADPAATRVGLGYTHSMRGGNRVVFAFDLEKTKWHGLHAHAGVEVRLHPMFSLRTGVSQGHLTAGTGLRWREVTVDYLFEDSALDPIHRVGLSLQFGLSTQQRRLAVLEAEERRIQERMSQAFMEVRSAQVEDFAQRARDHMLSENFEAALEVLGTVEVLDPQYPNLTGLQATCWKGQAALLETGGDLSGAAMAFRRALALGEDPEARAGLERVEVTSDLRAARSRERRELFSRALDDFASDELLQARAGFAQVLELDPEDREAREMLRRTEEAIDRNTQSLLEQARLHIRAHQLEEARSLIDRVHQLDANAVGLAQIDAQWQEARRRAVASPLVAPAAPVRADDRQPDPPAEATLSEGQRREVAENYQRALAALEAGRNKDAVRYLELVWSVDPDHQQVGRVLKEEYLIRGMESFASGDLEGAVRHWEDALRVDPDDERARGYLARVQAQRERIEQITRSR